MHTDAAVEERLDRLIRLWTERGWQIATCESCTGGFIAARFTRRAGCSSWYCGGIVSYRTEIKETLVGVPTRLIEQYGVVSEETAAAMAERICSLCRSDIGIATTGIAGPSGGTEATPVGTVCIALKTPRGMRSDTLHLAGERSDVIRRTYAEIIDRLFLWESL